MGRLKGTAASSSSQHGHLFDFEAAHKGDGPPDQYVQPHRVDRGLHAIAGCLVLRQVTQCTSMKVAPNALIADWKFLRASYRKPIVQILQHLPLPMQCCLYISNSCVPDLVQGATVGLRPCRRRLHVSHLGPTDETFVVNVHPL